MKEKKIKLAILSLLLLSQQSVFATTTQTALMPSVKISPMCVVTATNLDFGDLTARGAPSESWATGTVSAKCTKSTSYSIQLNYGTSVDSNNYRRLTGTASGAKIQYTMCQTKESSGVWGSTGGCVTPWRANFTVNSTGTGKTQDFTMYGLSQTNYYKADTYSDNMVVTLVY